MTGNYDLANEMAMVPRTTSPAPTTMRLVIFSTSRRNIAQSNTTHSGSVAVGGVTMTTGRSFHQALAGLGSSLTKVNSNMPAR